MLPNSDEDLPFPKNKKKKLGKVSRTRTAIVKIHSMYIYDKSFGEVAGEL